MTRLAALLLPALLLPLLPGAPASATEAPCADVLDLPGAGRFCPREDGLLEALGPSGERLGPTHGPDPVPDAAPLEAPVALPLAQPACVALGAAEPYHIQVIYARAADDADGYAARLPTIRNLVAQASALVDQAAAATGHRAALRVRCEGGLVHVAHEVLPTAKASASFGSIVADLRAKGYANQRVKHWVFYDDTGACACGGMGHLYLDDRANPENYNNGALLAQPTFAVDFGYDSVRIWLHELGHNLGAVQNSAPHSTLAGHCTDGRDTMCYNDGGPRGGSYATSACAVEVFDCGQDDYFNAAPPSGSYLASRWNLGSGMSRYVALDLPLGVCPEACR